MKILIIEDNDRLRKSLLDYLRDEGFAADGAADGEEGLYKAINWQYDALVLDVMVPKLDGFEVLSKLRAAGHTMPVIFLTARTELSYKLRGLDGGADDYLTKPFEMEELVSRLRLAIRRAGGSPNPIYTLGPITLNTAKRTAYKNDELIALTPLEYATMEMLIMRPDEVVTRNHLHEHLFDERDETLSNMLDVYIYKLRKKFGKEHILTRKGMGFVLTAGDTA